MRHKLYFKDSWAILMAVFLLSATPRSQAQTHEPGFKLISGSNGITLGKVNGMARDRHGVMWFTDENNGLVRYDGADLTAFQHDPQNPNSLGGKHPEAITIDSTGIIWIAHWGAGLDQFDPESKKFTHYRYQQDIENSLSNDSISSVLIDHLGTFWIGTKQGLDVLDPKTGTFRHYRHQQADPSSLSHNLVRTLYEDRAGVVWIGTGMPWETTSSGGLNRFNRKEQNFTRYLHNEKDPHSLINNKIRAILEDSRGTFWVGTAGDGLHSMDRKTGLFTRHVNDPTKPNKLSRPPVKASDDHITFLTEDAEGQIWIGTWSNGINRYNPVTQEIVYYGNGIGGLHDATGWLAKSYSDGLFWISMENPRHLYQVDLFTNNIPFISMEGFDIRQFYQDVSDVLWIATDKGLVKKNLTTGTIRIYKNEPTNPTSISGNDVGGILKDKQGNFWIGTGNGLNLFNTEKETFTRYQHRENEKGSIARGGILVMHEDHESNIWIGMWDAGVDKLDRKTGIFTHYVHSSDSNSIGGDLIPGLLEDESGDIWVGAWNGGSLNRLNPTTGKFSHYLRGNDVGSIYKDNTNIIWVCAHNDLYRYNRSTDKFISIGESIEGIEPLDIHAEIEDTEGNLWFAGNDLVRINKERNQFSKYGKDNGIDKVVSYLSAGRTMDGQLLFGTPGGYYAFKPSQLKANPLIPHVELTQFWIGNQLVKKSDQSFEGTLVDTKEIHLHHDQDVFSFEFSVTDYSNADNRKVFYSLQGYDIEWRQAGSEKRAYYFNVPPGRYTFRVKAFNSSNGIWQQKDVTIIISPPWWRTGWAYTLFGLAFVSLGYSGHRIQRARVIRAERERAKEKELAQAKEIEKAYHELRTTQSQLIQSEKMASLGELTAGIAHEIQNPLNFVNNFAEVNSELISEMKEELSKGNLADVKKIADDIDENEKKIMHHGKRADSIVKGMLQHSRGSNMMKEPTDINALCDEYLRLSYHGLRAKDKSFNASLKTEFDPTIGSLSVIPQDLGRVVLNLLTNAFYAVSDRKKKEPAGYEPTVTVKTQKAGNKLEILITDNGNGIPPHVLDKIFQPFFTTKPTGKGTGLGLSMSYDVIKAHGGVIYVKTRENEGTTFTIQLPYGTT